MVGVINLTTTQTIVFFAFWGLCLLSVAGVLVGMLRRGAHSRTDAPKPDPNAGSPELLKFWNARINSGRTLPFMGGGRFLSKCELTRTELRFRSFLGTFVFPFTSSEIDVELYGVSKLDNGVDRLTLRLEAAGAKRLLEAVEQQQAREQRGA